MQNGLRSAPHPFGDTDAILNLTSFETLQKHMNSTASTSSNTSPTLHSLGETLSNSYEGYPDMIKTVLQWLSPVVDTQLLIQQATINSCKMKEKDILKGFESYVSANDRMNVAGGVLKPLLLFDEQLDAKKSWKTDLILGIVGRYPNSTLAFHARRVDRLLKFHIEDHVYNDPQSIAKTVYQMIEHAFCIRKHRLHLQQHGGGSDIDTDSDSSFNEDNDDDDDDDGEMEILYEKLALLATHDEITSFTILRLLTSVSSNADNPCMRSVAREACGHIRREIATSSRIGLSLNDKKNGSTVATTASSSEEKMKKISKKYSVQMGFLADAVEAGEMEKDNEIIEAILGLLDANSNERNAYARRKMDKVYVTVISMLNSLLGKLDFVMNGSHANVLTNKFKKDDDDVGVGDDVLNGDGAEEDSDDEIIDVCDGDDDVKDVCGDDDVVETVYEMKVSTKMEVLLLRWLNYKEIKEEVLKALFVGSMDSSNINNMDNLTGSTNNKITPTKTATSLLAGAGAGIKDSSPSLLKMNKSSIGNDSDTSNKAGFDERRQRCLALVISTGCISEKYDDATLGSKIGKREMRKMINRKYRSIRKCVNACNRIRPSSSTSTAVLRLHEQTVDALMSSLSADKVCGQGVIEWIKNGVLINHCSSHVALLEGVLRAHETLVKEIILAMYGFYVNNNNREVRHIIVSALASWCRIGNGYVAKIILHQFHMLWIVHTHNFDKIVLRLFVKRLLQAVGPPFKHQFAKQLMSLLLNEHVEAAVNDDRKLACMVLDVRKHMYAASLI